MHRAWLWLGDRMGWDRPRRVVTAQLVTDPLLALALQQQEAIRRELRVLRAQRDAEIVQEEPRGA